MRRGFACAFLVFVASVAPAQQWSDVTVETTASGAQQLLLRDPSGANPRRIAVSDLIPNVPNAVTGVSISGSVLTFTFADGSTVVRTLPSAVDQPARDAAAAAQATADAATTPDEAKTIADQEILDTLEGLDIVSVASGTELLTFLGRHEGAAEYGLVHFTRDALQVYRTHTHQYAAGDVVLFRPGNIDPDDAEVLVTIPQELGSLRVQRIDSQAAFLAFLNAQVNSPTPAIAYAPEATQAERGAALFDIGAGDVMLFPSYSLDNRKVLFTIPPATPTFTVFTSAWLRGIVDTADLDGDYFLVVWNQERIIPQQYRPGSTTADPIDNLQLFVAAADGTLATVHRVQGYVYRSGVLVVPFNVSAAEESAAGQAVASTPGRIRWALQGNNVNARQSGPFYHQMPINSGFVAPSGGGGPVTFDSTAQPISDTADGGDRSTASRGDHIHELELNADHFIFVGDTTLTAQAALVNRTLPPFKTVLLSPGGIPGDDMVKRVRVVLHERNSGTPSIANVQLSISGQTIGLAESGGSPITPVSGLATASRGELVFELTDAQVSGIGDNITGTHIDVEVTFTFAAASGRTAHVESLTFGTNDPAFAAPPAPTPAAPTDTEIGGALTVSSRGNWNEYTITEAIESGSVYQWEVRVDADTRQGPTAMWRGATLLALPAQPDGNLTNADRNFIGVPSPRPDADGVRTFKFARHSNPLRLWVNVADPYNVLRLVKIGR